MSAAEQQLDGCPLPASDVARTDSIRSRVATVCNAGINVERDKPDERDDPLSDTATSGGGSLSRGICKAVVVERQHI